jgi:cell division protein FtsI/penicillin-binding protein 2
MMPPQNKKRTALVFVGLAMIFALLGYRLVDLQLLRAKELAAQAQANREQIVQREGRRGVILDANGNLLASSLSVRIVCADPSVTGPNAPQIAAKLSPLLRIEPEILQTRLSGGGRYVRLKSKVDEETAQKIRALRIRGLSFEDQFLRSYPNNELASHVLGYVNFEHRGVDGIEAAMDEYLRGQTGWEIIERDRKGREIRVFRGETIGPRDGYNVVLTIDQVIQHIAESELERAMDLHRPQAGTVIVTRPKTGEILALANRPAFDPNNMGHSTADSRRNRAITDVAEPGSTFKIVVVAAALNERIVSLSDRFDCENGHFIYAGRSLKDAHPHGILTVEEILSKSSNIGAAKIGLRLGEARMYEYMRRFGFGRRTGIALPGEVSGIVHPLSRWSKLSITRIPMGHEVAATPLQMAMAMGAIANGGLLMKPLVVQKIMDQEGNEIAAFAPQIVSRVIEPRTTTWMTASLSKVPAMGGTAPQAAVEGYAVAGKTGTAQKLENGQYVNRYYSSFIGYLPANDPEILVLISLDDPRGGSYYGGSVAGPVFRAMAEKIAQYLDLPPQKDLKVVMAQ